MEGRLRAEITRPSGRQSSHRRAGANLGSRRRAEVNSASGMIEEETMNRSYAIHSGGSLVIRTAKASAASSVCVVAASNKALEPTPVTKARLVWFSSGAAQRKRYAVRHRRQRGCLYDARESWCCRYAKIACRESVALVASSPPCTARCSDRVGRLTCLLFVRSLVGWRPVSKARAASVSVESEGVVACGWVWWLNQP